MYSIILFYELDEMFLLFAHNDIVQIWKLDMYGPVENAVLSTEAFKSWKAAKMKNSSFTEVSA